MKYDSTVDTLKHQKRVCYYLIEASKELLTRASIHDSSKLETPEKELFDEFSSKLASSTYGSPEYINFLEGLKDALDHHYQNNTHHPQHYEDGVDGMNLFDIIEMFYDWKAASERHGDGNFEDSLKLNKDRFHLSDQLYSIFCNTFKKFSF